MDTPTPSAPEKPKRKRVWKVLRWAGVVLIVLGTAIYYSSIESVRRLFAFIEVDNGLGFFPRIYGQDHEGFYPPLSPQAGRLMYDVESVPRDELLYWVNTATYPGEPGRRGEHDFEPPISDEEFAAVRELLNDQSYYYLGYFVTNEVEGRAFVSAYKETIARGGTFEDDLIVPQGQGNFGKDRLYRLRDTDALIKDLQLSEDDARRFQFSAVLLFQNPRKRAKAVFPPPWRDKAFIYTAAHAGYTCDIPGDFPCTEEFLSALEELDRMSDNGPPERPAR